jgi:hypothetical protein
MVDLDSSHARLQQQIDCQLEVKPRMALEYWEKSGWEDVPGSDVDESPIKYMSLCLLDAIEEKAARITLDKDKGVTVHGDSSYSLPKAPPHIIARGLEILREITGLQGPSGRATLCLGIRNDSVELTIQKNAGLHTINIPIA